MLIGILSDTHDNMAMIRKAVAAFKKHNVAAVLHAGDIVSPFTATAFRILDVPMTAVFGNNDGDKMLLKEKFAGIAEFFEGNHEGVVGEKKYVMMHRPQCIAALAASKQYDLIVYGHTHEAVVRQNATLIVNPGECAGWLGGNATVALWDVERMEVEIVNL